MKEEEKSELMLISTIVAWAGVIVVTALAVMLNGCASKREVIKSERVVEAVQDVVEAKKELVVVDPLPTPRPTPLPFGYEVQSGDTLWGVSGMFWGDPYLWPRWWRENRDRIMDPDKIEVGDVLLVPGRNLPLDYEARMKAYLEPKYGTVEWKGIRQPGF